jgi:hypothetical protein
MNMLPLSLSLPPPPPLLAGAASARAQQGGGPVELVDCC